MTAHFAACWRITERHRGLSLQRAFTLVEMLVAMVLTLILVYAIAEFYAYVGETVRDGRAMIEISSQLRGGVQRLKSDLDQITVRVTPWTDEGSASGYITIYEGLASDADIDGDHVVDTHSSETADFLANSASTLLGDADDVLAMTIRAAGEPFTGRNTLPIGGSIPPIITAPHAEVIWWVGFDDIDGDGDWDLGEPRKIYRRQLLIRPDIALGNEFDYDENGLAAALQFLTETFWRQNDISVSVRRELNATGGYVYRLRANSLADLSRRENRFAHLPALIQGGNVVDLNFPNRLLLTPAATSTATAPANATLSSFVLQGDAMGEDVILSNVLAFDVRVYDPYAVLYADVEPAAIENAVNALMPGDPGYLVAISSDPRHPQVGTGAFVDLAYGVTLINMLTNPPYNLSAPVARTTVTNAVGTSYFASRPPFNPDLNPPAAEVNYVSQLGLTYDTWAQSYERDGINQDGDSIGSPPNTTPLIDEGTNGLDDDGRNGVDDIGERETVPPYSHPLRGIEVKIRLYEPGTRQVRQATVGADFVGE